MLQGEDRLNDRDDGKATRREVLLYWAGFLIITLGAVSILMTISGVLIDVLSSRCWYPIISPMMGQINHQILLKASWYQITATTLWLL
jgi:hypothetical protein